jgi:hypothetical protein
LGTAIVCIALAASLAFAALTLSSRPLENTEGCVLFEASRIRAGLPLYTDPVVGANEYGEVPARYYVVYPPIWAFLLSAWPEGLASRAGRAMSIFVWYGVLFWLGWVAHRRKRPAGVLAAAFVGGVYTLTLYGASLRPDALAVGLAAIAFARAVRANEAGPLEAGLFTLAAWMKPNVIGLGMGVAMHAARRGARARWTFGAGLLVGATILVFIHHASRGSWLLHLASATLQPWNFHQWALQISTRAPFFALPIAFALWSGVSPRTGRGPRVAALALTTSLACTLVSLGKVGSATCYWMEPCMGAVVVLAHFPLPRLSPRSKTAIAVAVPLQALWTGVASVRSSLESIADAPEKKRVLGELRRRLPSGSLLLSDDAGIELALSGRLIDTPFQTTQLIRRGRFPEALWIADVTNSRIAGLVTDSDLLERPLTLTDPARDRYDVTLRRVLRNELVLARREAGLYIYSRR